MSRAILIVEQPRLLQDCLSAALADMLDDRDQESSGDEWQLDLACGADEGLGRVLEQLGCGERYGTVGIDCGGGRGAELVQALWALDPELRIVLRLDADDDSWRWLDERWGRHGRLLVVTAPIDGAELRRLADVADADWQAARHTHLKLRQLRGLLREQTPDGRWDWDLARNRVVYSRRWKTLAGHDEGDVGVAPAEWLDRVHSDDRAAVERAIAMHLGGRSRTLTVEFRLRQPDGSLRWMACRGQAERAQARLAGVMHDVGDRRQAEAQLRLLTLNEVPAANDHFAAAAPATPEPLRALVDLRNGRVAGLSLRPEAPLLRLADETVDGGDEVVALDDWALGAALAELARLGRRGDGEVALAIAVEATQLVQPGFLERVAERRAQAGLSARRVRLLVSERELVALPAQHELGARLWALGLGLQVSEFGVAGAPLGYLTRLPVEALQLDDDVTDEALVRAAATLGHALDLAVLVDAGPELGAEPADDEGAWLAAG